MLRACCANAGVISAGHRVDAAIYRVQVLAVVGAALVLASSEATMIKG